jgi:uncharacterized protein (TIGR03000 family)
MFRQTFSALVVTAAGLLCPVFPVAAAPPANASNNPFPQSYYGFNPGYYGPYYPGQYRYGNVDPRIYNNPSYPGFLGSGPSYRAGYGTSSGIPVPYSYQLYGSSPRFGAPSDYAPSVTTYRLPASNLAPLDASRARDDNRVLVEVHLPAPDAELWVEGKKTVNNGTQRRFASPPLDLGEHYVYEFRARWFENGHAVLRTQRVPVQAGQLVVVDFAP